MTDAAQLGQDGPVSNWEVWGYRFGGATVRTAKGDRVEDVRYEVSAYRRTKVVPSGKKRPVEVSEPVMQRVVMSGDAWAEMSAVLRAAGAKVKEEDRSW